MSTNIQVNLGFAGGGLVGRAFTVQDLFSAVASQNQNASATTSVMVVNESYLDSDGIAVSDAIALAVFTHFQTAYNSTIWQNGVWS